MSSQGPSQSDEEGWQVETYEWAGGILAGLGFLMSPFVIAGPAAYFALLLRKKRRLSAIAIVAVLVVATLFWFPFLLLEGPRMLVVLVTSGAVIAVLTAVVGAFRYRRASRNAL